MMTLPAIVVPQLGDLVEKGLSEMVLARSELLEPDELRDFAAEFEAEAVKRKRLGQEFKEVAKSGVWLRWRWGEKLGPPPGPGARTDLSTSADGRGSPVESEARLVGTRPESDIRKWMDAGKLLWRAIVIQARKARRDDLEGITGNPNPADVITDRYQLLFGDLNKRLAQLEPESVDLIFTDPPYPREYLPLWDDLARHARRLLKPNGVLIAYSGLSHLPDVLELLGEHLEYRHVYAVTLEGSAARHRTWPVRRVWKPLLAYQPPNSKRPDQVPNHPDLLSAGQRDKGLYEWQQTVGPGEDLIGLWTEADGVVLDPFMGVGSFGVAALQLGRQFIGVELDPERFARSAQRLSDVQ